MVANTTKHNFIVPENIIDTP